MVKFSDFTLLRDQYSCLKTCLGESISSYDVGLLNIKLVKVFYFFIIPSLCFRNESSTKRIL